MAGLISYAAYVPPTRMSLALPAGGAAGGPERAVAWFDEDSVTMAAAAGLECLRGRERERVDALFFASTTAPFAEKQTAALLAKVLDLPAALRCADFGGSLRAGSDALAAAFDAVAAGSAKCVLVLASDVRPAAPGSALERSFGDGAAAFLVSAGDDADAALLATHEGAHFVAEEIVDRWRAPGDAFVHSWEERFVVQEGYTPGVTNAVRALLAQLGAQPAAFSKFALAAPDARTHAALARALGFAREACVEPHFGALGHAGVAFAPLLLIAALENAQPGERVLLANYGDGCAAHAFQTCAALAKFTPRRALAKQLARRVPVARYEQFLRARDLLPREFPAPRGPGLSATAHLREREDELAFQAQRCRACGKLQFPAQRVCEHCGAKDDFTRERLSDKRGAVVTYTLDYFYPAPTPPTIVSVVEVEDARVHLQLTGVSADEVRTGMPVEFALRRIHSAGGRPNYYWKAQPARADEEEPT